MMKDYSCEWRSRKTDTSKDFPEIKATAWEKIYDGIESLDRAFSRRYNPIEPIEDELIDSLHLTRKRLKTSNRYQIIEKNTELDTVPVKNKRVSNSDRRLRAISSI
jgi:hypothetical protein